MPIIPSQISNVVVEPLTVTATTSSQTIPVSAAINGYGPITVNPVTNEIDANITAENIKKDITILGVTGTHEGGGGINPEEYLAVYFCDAGGSTIYQFVKKSEWDNISAGDVLNLYDELGNLITGVYRPNPGMTFTFTAPYTLQSKGTRGILDVASIKDVTNQSTNLNILKTENCYAIYSTYMFNGNKTLVVSPLYPKIGDEIKQYSDNAYYLIDSIIYTGTDIPGYSVANPFRYYETKSMSSEPTIADGPITIKDIKIEKGFTTLILQDKNGNILNNTWRMATPSGWYPNTITENGNYNVSYYEVIDVQVPTPPSKGGGYVPLAFSDPEGTIYTRDFNSGSASDFYTWKNGDGIFCYTPPLNNLSELTKNTDMFLDWALQNPMGLTPTCIYGGGIRTENGTAYIKDLCEGELRLEDAYGMSCGFPEYKLPEAGQPAGPWGMVEEVYDSTIPMPVAIRGGNVGWLFFDRTDGDEYEPRMIFCNNYGSEYSVCGSKFYGIGNYSICDYMGYSQEDTIVQYSFLGIIVNGEKYASTGNIEGNIEGMAAEFTNGTQTFYVNINDPLNIGTAVYDNAYDLTNPVGYIDEVMNAQ